MGKQAAVWVFPHLGTVGIRRRNGLCKHSPVIRQDLAAGDPVLENSGSGVIRIIDHRIALYHEKISHIDSHCEK